MRSTVLRTALSATATALIFGTALSGTAAATSGPALLANSAGSATDAVQLLDDGKPVAARELLRDLVRETAGAERDNLLALLDQANSAMRALTLGELRVQRAELLVRRGDLRGAEAQLETTRRDTSTEIATRAKASNLLDEIARQRLELQPLADSALRQAVSDFRSERYADAKAGFTALDRAGLKLSGEQDRTIALHLERIERLENDRGERFDAPAISLGAFAARDAAAGLADAARGAAAEEQDDQRARARRILEEANAAFDEGRYTAADQLYSRVLQMPLARYLSVEEVEAALERLREARRLGGIEAGGDQVQEAAERIEVIRGQYRAEVGSLLRQAEEALDRGDPQTAQTRLAQAEVTWDTAFSDGYFNERENQAQQRVFDELRQRIESERERIAAEERETAERDREIREQQATAQAELERLETINEFLDQLRALQTEQRYEDALEVVDNILFLDANHQPALMMKRVLEDILVYREALEIRRDRDLSIAREMNTMHLGTIVPDAILEFPEDWPQLSVDRLQWSDADDFTESPRDRAVLARMESVTLPANFDGVELESVVQFVASVTNLNVDVDWDSLEFIGIDRETEVELDLTSDVTAATLLDRVLEKISPDDFDRAGWAVQDGIVILASEQKLRENTFIVIYDVRDLIFEIPDFEAAPELDLDSVLGGAQGGGGQSPFDDDDDDEDGFSIGFGEEEEDNLDDLLEIIRTSIDPDGWVANGGETGVVQPFQQYLVVTNTSKNHRSTRDLLRQLREIRNIQVSVESRFLTVSQNFFEQIGFDIDVIFNAETDARETIQSVVEPFYAFPQGDLIGPGGGVQPDGSILQPGETGTVFAWQPTDQGPVYGPIQYTQPYADNFGPVPADQNSLGLSETLLSGTDFATDILNSNPALSVAGTFFDDIQVDFLIQATQADRRSVVLQAPRLTFTNGKVANVAVTTQTAYIADLNPVVGSGSVAFDPVPATQNDGFSLVVGGVVSADRRFVTLAVQIAFAQLIELQALQITAAAGGDGGDDDGGSNVNLATGTIQQPVVAVTQVDTGVTIPDRGTILLGGQRISNEIEIETGVPVLSKIPVLNRFFTNRVTDVSDETLLVLMKPTIIIQGEEEDKNFPGLADQLDAAGFGL